MNGPQFQRRYHDFKPLLRGSTVAAWERAQGAAAIRALLAACALAVGLGPTGADAAQWASIYRAGDASLGPAWPVYPRTDQFAVKFGGAIAGSGDFDGDGARDLALCSYEAGDRNGVCGIFLDAAAHVAGGPSYSALDGGNGVRLCGPSAATGCANGQTGRWLGADMAVGDVNGDGFDDLIAVQEDVFLQSPRDGDPQVHVLFGRATFDSAEVAIERPGDLIAELDGDSGFHIVVPLPDTGNYYGGPLRTGDVDNDGFDDIVLGGHAAVHVVRGRSTFPALLDAADDALTMRIEGLESEFTLELATGDLNLDGFDDIAIGDGMADSSRGAVRVVLGAAAMPGVVDASALALPAGYSIRHRSGETVRLGNSVTTGDFDGDGHADLALGTGNDADGRAEGGVFVLYANDQRLADVPSLDAAAGMHVFGLAAVGALEAIGDLDGDRRDELAFGSASGLHIVFGDNPARVPFCALRGVMGLTVERRGGSARRIGQRIGDIDGNGRDDFLLPELGKERLVLGESLPIVFGDGFGIPCR